MANRAWCMKDHEILARHYGRLAVPELAIILGRSRDEVVTEANRLGFVGLEEIRQRRRARNMANRNWSDSERETLRRHYGKLGAGDIGRVLGRSARAVQHEASKLGLEARARPQRDAMAELATRPCPRRDPSDPTEEEIRERCELEREKNRMIEARAELADYLGRRWEVPHARVLMK